jgi:AcrR family transcriptional regulator
VSFEVIWTRPERPARGPAPAYSRAQITAVSVKLADAEGLDALSMRRVARELGAGTMSLYRYIRTKDELIQLMIDEVVGETVPADFARTGDWRADLWAIAHLMRDSMRRHPWMLAREGEFSFGPNTLRVVETVIGSLDGLGLNIDEMMSLTGMVQSYVSGTVRAENAEAELDRRTRTTREERMQIYAPYARRMLDTGRYPILERIIMEAEQPHMDPDQRFDYGLERILDGIAGSLPDQNQIV